MLHKTDSWKMSCYMPEAVTNMASLFDEIDDLSLEERMLQLMHYYKHTGVMTTLMDTLERVAWITCIIIYIEEKQQEMSPKKFKNL